MSVVDLILTLHYVVTAVLEYFTNLHIKTICGLGLTHVYHCNITIIDAKDFPIINNLASLIYIYIYIHF